MRDQYFKVPVASFEVVLLLVWSGGGAEGGCGASAPSDAESAED